MREQFRALGREGDGARAALEQAVAEFALELGDLRGDARLRDVQRLGGRGEGAAVGHGDEVAELVQFHHC